ncbi:MAG: hypothetical protein K9L17_07505 [Clostridiales bacterium]|nr:hypothetical protein [Clostridiales bacterium]MCF8022517.1 hypothetical protein [Clostridiales bacterium]
MSNKVDVDNFVKEHQEEITSLVNNALNRAGDIIQRKVASGDVQANMQDVLPVLLYEVLTTHTVATLRLVGEMISEDSVNKDVN